MFIKWSTFLLLICLGQFFYIIFLLNGNLDVMKTENEGDNSCNYKNVTSAEEPSSVSFLNGVFSSSVFCTGRNKSERECRFQNLCYRKDSQKFLYFHGPKSASFGLPENYNGEVLLDLSSVDDHNAKYFVFENVTSEHRKVFSDGELIKGSGILFHRFNPENLMHVLHDDLIPLYHTSRKYFPLLLKENKLKLFMLDGRNETEFTSLYHLYSNKIYLESNFTRTLTCFEDVIVGLSKVTTWYQYGFRTSQGPIDKPGYPISELRYFRNDFQQRLHGDTGKTNADTTKGPYIVFFSRSTTRLIVNENQLIFKLSVFFQLPVQMVSFETEKIIDIVTLVSGAYMVIGAHGAHLITCLFMKSSSYLVELFPFGVPAKKYSPYKTMVKFLNIRYISWENQNESSTVTHPDWPAYLGGIQHLSVELQKNITETKTVPTHLCCKDPFWLFRIYQDTIVDIDSFLAYLEEQIG